MDSRTARNRMAWLAPLALGLLGVGFLFHTSHDARLLGKYNPRYFSFLCLWFLVLLPLSYWVARFLLAEQTVRLRSRRQFRIRPRNKLLALLLVSLAGYIAADLLVRRHLAQRTLTHAHDDFHPYLQNTPRAGDPVLRINRWGFRGEEIERAKPAGTFRIFVLGGSTVFCGRVPFEVSWCRVLEKRLQKAYPHVSIEVQNAGAEWHASQHSVIKLLFNVQDFDPDLVIFSHGINDLCRGIPADAFCSGDYRADYGHYHGPVVNLRRPGHAAQVMVRSGGGFWFSDFRYRQVRLLGPEGKGLNNMVTMFFPAAQETEIVDWPSLPDFQRNIVSFVSSAKAAGIEIMFATQPSLYRADLDSHEKSLLVFPISHQFDGQMASLESMCRGMEQFNGATRAAARESGVPLVDLARHVPKTLDIFYDDVHYTNDGNAEVGRLVTESVINATLIPNPPSESGESH